MNAPLDENTKRTLKGAVKPGQRFGRLLTIKRAADAVTSRGIKLKCFDCVCDCGNLVSVRAGCLNSGNTRSCGCFHKEELRKRLTRHGMTGTRVFNAWLDMRKRCLDKSHSTYPNYGGRGITICDRWLTFENFLADMGTTPDGRTLERKEVNGNYEPTNCTWATHKEQMRNTRRTFHVTLKDRTQSLAAWCEEKKLNYKTVIYRLRYLGWPAERALS